MSSMGPPRPPTTDFECDDCGICRYTGDIIQYRYSWNARGDDARHPISTQHAKLVAKFTAAIQAGVRFGSNGQPLTWDPVTFPGVGHDGQHTEYTFHRQTGSTGDTENGEDRELDEYLLLWEAASQAGCRFGDDGMPLGWNPTQGEGICLRDGEPKEFIYHHQFRQKYIGTVKSDMATAAGENKRLVHEAAKEAGLKFDEDGSVRSFNIAENFHDSNVIDIAAAATNYADVKRSAAATDDADVQSSRESSAASDTDGGTWPPPPDLRSAALALMKAAVASADRSTDRAAIDIDAAVDAIAASKGIVSSERLEGPVDVSVWERERILHNAKCVIENQEHMVLSLIREGPGASATNAGRAPVPTQDVVLGAAVIAPSADDDQELTEQPPTRQRIE